MNKTPLTIRGAELLRAELHRLKTVERPNVIAAIAEARSHGDLSENAEYDAAKERQGFLEGRIKELEGKIANAQIIDPGRRLSPAAARSAVFIMLYRDEPIFQMPFALLQSLLDIDESMAQWRSRHLNMVRRMIGMRMGTGGSTGSGYLKGALDSHYIFGEIAELSSFLIERRRLPQLPDGLRRVLGFGGATNDR